MSLRLNPARLALLAILMISLSSCVPSDTPDGPVDVFVGPQFVTGDAERPVVYGLAVAEGRVVALLEREDVAKWASRGATLRQLPGEYAVPGLVDAHAHILGYGATLSRVDLVGANSLAEAVERVASYAGSHEHSAWILGRGWDQNDWPGGRWPHARDLDAVVAERPVALRRIDGHALWANSAALALAGIEAGTPDPKGGSIHRDAKGQPTGILIDAAIGLVERLIPEPSDAEEREALIAAAEALTAAGLTGVHDMGVDERTWRLMNELAAEGLFPLNVHAYASAGSELYATLRESGRQHSGRLHLEGVKLFADGALGSRGARLLAPYSDEPGNEGLWLLKPGELKLAVREAMEAGLQPAVHAIGDAANRAVLDAFELGIAHGEPALPPRVEHAQILDPADLPRFAKLGVVASMQPTHATSDMGWAGERLGEARLEGAYAWQSLLESGALVAFGSDFPVEAIDPRFGLYSAITRQDHAGSPAEGWRPDERLSWEEALEAFTAGAARAVGAEADEGSLKVGAWCDVTVFDRKLGDGAPRAVLDAKVTATVISGVQVH